MTVNTVNITSGPYAGNDVADTFSYTFKVTSKTELTVVEEDDLGAFTELVVDSDFTVNTVGDPAGGTITRIAGPLPTGYKWHIRANYQETQLTSFGSQGPFFPDIHEKAMDKLTYLVQQILEALGRTIMYPFYGGDFDAKGKRIKNLGGYVDGTDAVNAGDVAGMINDVNAGVYDHGLSVNKDAPGKAHDQIYRRKTTSAQVATAVFKDGDTLVLTDRNRESFDVSLGTPDGFGLIDAGGGLIAANIEEYPSAKGFGAAGDGVTVDAGAINAVEVDYYRLTKGSYLYDGATTPDYSKVLFEAGADFIGMTNPISITFKDVGGSVKGIQHNYNEEKRNLSGVTPQITTGSLDSPPISQASPSGDVEIMAHWYNDFGLEYTRVQDGAGGWVGWYTWEWNHTDTALDGPYDPSRHPVLGWYRGDDATVLDWQCYWLREAGVSGVIIQATGLDTATWNAVDDRDYWMYQLFKNTPNFKGLSYVVGGPVTGTQAEVEAAWTKIINDIYLVHGNYQVVEIGQRRYPAIYLHDVGTLRAGVFGTDAAFEAWLKTFADTFKSAGFDGVFVYGRLATYYTSEANKARYEQRLPENGIVMVEVDYGNFSGTYVSPTVYSDYVSAFGSAYDAAKFRRLPNVMTSRDSKNHPTGYDTPGSTPALFRDVLEKAANAAAKNTTIPSIVTIYNVAEWAEAGASLQPSVGYGWGYLDACRQVAIENLDNAKPNTLELSYLKRVDGAAQNIKPVRDYIRLYTTFSVTLNSGVYLPTISDGAYDGQEIELMNQPVSGSFNIILHDNSQTAGTKLYLSTTTYSMGAYDSLRLRWSTLRNGWVETGRVNVL